jgi:uncharacterized protein (DUF169 family)
MINKLKQYFGSKCTSIYINNDVPGFINFPLKQMKFCEAVDQSFKVPLKLNIENLGCPGARRSVGFETDNEQLAADISDNSNIPLKFIKNALQAIPAMTRVRHINLGLNDYPENELQPDLFILYVQSFQITDLIFKLAKMAIKPSIPPYLMLSVCGNIFANSYLNQVVSISFGCPESRKSGAIGKNEIVVGLPFKIAVDLLHYYE